ncbi:hypothetical protein F4860DRAFT_242615 [Xylaria cubensis]|nr:hypothetical protein F4860DRAFT_242615 [Xylaria cubensis]
MGLLVVSVGWLIYLMPEEDTAFRPPESTWPVSLSVYLFYCPSASLYSMQDIECTCTERPRTIRMINHCIDSNEKERDNYSLVLV